MEEVMKAPVTETVEEVKAAAAEETEVKEEAPAQAEETEVKEEAMAEEAPAAAEPKAEETPAEAPKAEEAPAAEEPKAEAAPAESMADYEAEIDASLRRYERDEKVKCTVISVDVDKVMVELGSTTGIIRKQDVSDDPSYNLQENIKPGDEIEATVLRSDDGHGHVVLSMKAAATAKAWNRLTSLLESKDNVGVKITGITKAGVITMLEGVRGFIPASKLSLGYIAEDELPNWIGKTIETRVITAEKDGRKLVLSAKEILREKEAQERKDAAAVGFFPRLAFADVAEDTILCVFADGAGVVEHQIRVVNLLGQCIAKRDEDAFNLFAVGHVALAAVGVDKRQRLTVRETRLQHRFHHSGIFFLFVEFRLRDREAGR